MFFFNHKKNKQQDILEENESLQEHVGEKLSDSEDSDKETEKLEAGDKASDPLEERPLLGFALFKDRAFDMTLVKEMMEERAHLSVEINESAELPSFIIKNEEGTFVCTHMPMPIPNQEVQNHIGINFIEKEYVEDIRNHQSFIVIARIKEPYKSRINACVTFSKIASVLMMLENAAGMFIEDLSYIIPAKKYSVFFNQMMQSDNDEKPMLPLPLWIKMSMVQNQKGIKATTKGLSAFGLHELGFHYTHREPDKIFDIIMNLCTMYLLEHCRFEDGDTMRLDPQTEASFKLEGNTLFIYE